MRSAPLTPLMPFSTKSSLRNSQQFQILSFTYFSNPPYYWYHNCNFFRYSNSYCFLSPSVNNPSGIHSHLFTPLMNLSPIANRQLYSYIPRYGPRQVFYFLSLYILYFWHGSHILKCLLFLQNPKYRGIY